LGLVADHWRIIGTLVGLAIAAGGLFGFVLSRWQFYRGLDHHSIEILGAAVEPTPAGSENKLPFTLTADVWGHAISTEDVMGNKIGGQILSGAIKKTPTDKPYVILHNHKILRRIIGKIDGRLDGNDWQGNADRVKRRKTIGDRFGCCLFGVADPIDHVKEGVLMVFDDEKAVEYAAPGFAETCGVVDAWQSHLPNLLHLAAVLGWTARRTPGASCGRRA